MSEELSQNGHAPMLRESIADLESLPPAIQALHTRLLEDGATFRAGLPDTSQITRRAILQLDPKEPFAIGNERETALDDKAEARRQIIPPDLAQPRHVRHHMRRLPAVAAMLTVVGLLAALFATLAPGRFGRLPVHPHPVIHRVIGGSWTDLRLQRYPFPDAIGGDYVVAPGDPRVVYYIGVVVSAGTAEEVFARLDNGQRWVSLSFPLPNIAGVPASHDSQKGIGYQLDVMPNNPMALILELEVDGTSTCPIAHPATYICDEYLYSSDGGAHWRSLRQPGSGLLGLWLALDNGTVNQPYWNQDGRLYTTLSPAGAGYIPTGVRIISSADNGASWQYADGNLTTNGQHVYEFVPAAHGATLYAVTQAATYTGPRQLWRSNGAGADWQLVGPMSSQAELIGVTAQNGTSLPVLYRDQQVAPDGNTRTNLNRLIHPEVSVDGGRTWTRIPFAGLPTDTGGDPYTLGTLSDGSLIAVLPGRAWEQSNGNATANLSFYAWAPGDTTWRRLAPLISNLYLSNATDVVLDWWLIPNASSSPERLCVSGVGGDFSGNGWGIECSTLT